jgi:predicted permease
MSILPAPARHALRKLVRAPLFTTVAVLTLALGIGANTAVFSVVNGVLLRPLPFDAPDELVGIWHTAPGLGFEQINQSPALHYTYEADSRAFAEIGMWDNSSASITGLDEPQQVEVMFVTWRTPHLLRLTPEIGRFFTAEDDLGDAPETVVLSAAYWRDQFGADPGVIGSTLIVEAVPHEIIGVMGADVEFLDYEPAIYLPFRFNRDELFVGNFSYQAVGRLAPGYSIEQANAEIERLIWVGVERYPNGLQRGMLEEAGFGASLRPLKQDVVGDVGDMLWVLLGTVGLVLLIAAANVANLFLVRAENRQLEISVRTALGASRGVIVRDFLAESVTLALLGGVAGLGLAWAGIRFLVYLNPSGLPRLSEISIDPLVIAFGLGTSLVAGLLFGIVPAFKYGSDLGGAIKEGGRGGSAGKERHRLRNALVVGQMALALMLLIGAGLMIRSLVAMRSVDPGFTGAEQMQTVRVSIPRAEIREPVEAARAHRAIHEALAAIPGVESVGSSSSFPLDGWDSNDALEFEVDPLPEGTLPPIRRFKWIQPGFFETTGRQLLAGRTISWQDIEDQTMVMMVSENLALEYWDSPNEALGQRARFPGIFGDDNPWREIIGVVADEHDDGLDQAAPEVIYWPIINRNFWSDDIQIMRTQRYIVRSDRVGQAGLLDEIRDAIWSVNPNLPLASVRTAEEILDRSMARTSFTLVMLSIASGVALLLGAVGIYGVTSYVVAQRTREIGVRMALGAQEGQVSKMVLRQGLVLALIGVAIGLVGAFAATRLMAALLYGVSTADPVTYGAVAIALTAVAMVACYVPARRAARIDPIEALRWE